MDKLSLPQEVGLSLVGPSFHPPPQFRLVRFRINE